MAALTPVMSATDAPSNNGPDTVDDPRELAVTAAAVAVFDRAVQDNLCELKKTPSPAPAGMTLVDAGDLVDDMWFFGDDTTA